MKFLIFLFTILFSSTSIAIDNPWDIKLPFKEATIHFDVKGSMSGTKVLYIKDYGRISAEYSDTSMTMFGMKQEHKEVEITTPDWVYSIDLIHNKGSKQTNPMKFFIKEFNQLSKSDQKKVAVNAEKFGINSVQGMGGKVTKNATKILGFNCDKTDVMGTVVYSIVGTGLPLKVESNMMSMQHNETAIRFEKDAGPASKYTPPKNIALKYDRYADQMMQQQAKNMMQNLLNDKAPAARNGSGPMGSQPPANQPQDNPNQMSPEQQQQLQQMMKMFGG